MTQRTIQYRHPIPVRPWDHSEDMRQRDHAAYMAQEWARREFPEASFFVESVNRGPKNLVVRLCVTDR